MNKITFLQGAETRCLRKIVQRSRDKDLSRRANAVLLVLQGKTRVEIAAALQAARSSVNRWLSWYEASKRGQIKKRVNGVRSKLTDSDSSLTLIIRCLQSYWVENGTFQRYCASSC